ncbi:M48 family metallopeptidase [Stutzerimonas nitrititolerans]|uniref:M48 family metallopeptidase n=1 Tax=Stutzerimonas nitrititolerans TaxID=2482751 RepID=UPI0028A776DC|nr:M48 family metallopeptidase [Stutzerimonas nitrititolerans]
MQRLTLVFALTQVILLAGCSGVQTTQPGVVGVDRTQYMIDSLPARELNGAYAKAYAKAVRRAEAEGKLVTESPVGRRVIDISVKLVEQVPAFRLGAERWGWFVNVIDEDIVNANCGPGGKILVYTGLIDRLALTDDELAVVLGHEIGHGLRDHAREHISTKAGFEITGALGSSVLGAGSLGKTLISKSLDVGVGLGFSRRDEVEADLIGLELVARAGFDPRASVSLWEKMAAISQGGGMPAFLSTHPSDRARIKRLNEAMPKVMPLFRAASMQIEQREPERYHLTQDDHH